jgi:PAS domain S-box-containing protein
MKSSLKSYLLVFSGLLCIYFATARLGLNIMPVSGIAALVWPPSGIALAALFIFGYRYWPAVALGEFLANAFFGMPIIAACAVAIGNSLEAITGVYLLRNVVRFRTDLSTIKSVIGLLLLAAFTSTAISATAGVTGLYLTGKISAPVYWITWRAWWIGNALGDIIVASLIFVWSSRRWSVLKPSTIPELVVLMILAIGVALLIFARAATSPELYLLFCFIIWSALRFSPRETITLIFVISVIAISGTSYRLGPFSERSVSENLLLLKLFMGVLSATGMLLCAAVVEHREAEEKFKLVFSSSPIAMTITDLAGKILIVNPQAEKLFGYKLSDIVGLQVEKLMPFCVKDKGHLGQSGLFKSLETQPVGIELCGVRKDNVELQLQVSLTPINTTEGMQLLSSIIDITERKRNDVGLNYLSETGVVLSKSLDYSETLKKTVQLPLPTLADWCIVDLVDSTMKQVAIAYPDSQKEMITEELSNRIPPDPSLGRGTAYVLQSGKSEMFTNLTNDTDWIARTLGLAHPQFLQELGAVSYICVPLITRGRILGAMTYVSRVSKCRYDLFYLALVEEIASRAAIAIDNAQLYLDAQKAIHMRDYFLSVVSHDLKNPLFAISAGTTLLMDSQLPMERAMVQNIAEQMSKSTSRMDRLIHDLLDLAKLEENQLRIDQRRYNSATLLDEAISQIEIQLKKKQLNLVKNYPQVSYFVSCDHERALQIIVNLLDNAIKFTPDGGTITISTKQSENAIEFSISDTGPGIHQDQLPHIFDRYWQADRSSRRGAGLGLSIVSELIKVHGGKIRVESKLNQGTTFFFTLPAD